jgi:hypothetical protein
MKISCSSRAGFLRDHAKGAGGAPRDCGGGLGAFDSGGGICCGKWTTVGWLPVEGIDEYLRCGGKNHFRLNEVFRAVRPNEPRIIYPPTTSFSTDKIGRWRKGDW